MTGIRHSFLALPVLMRLGFVAFAMGGVGDLLLHVAPVEWHAATAGYGGAGEYVFHLITVAGMCMTVLGVLTFRLRVYAPVRAAEVREEEEVSM